MKKASKAGIFVPLTMVCIAGLGDLLLVGDRVSSRDRPAGQTTTPDGASMTLHSVGGLVGARSVGPARMRIFNSGLVADNWPTSMDESDLSNYHLA
jgi:hypothetical protein